MNSQEEPNSSYVAYLLRMWRKKDGSGKPVWCASLQEPGSGNIESFGDMSALFAVLQSRTGTGNSDSAPVNTQVPIDYEHPNGQSPPPGPPEG